MWVLNMQVEAPKKKVKKTLSKLKKKFSMIDISGRKYIIAFDDEVTFKG